MNEQLKQGSLVDIFLPGDTIHIRQLVVDDAQRYFDLMSADRDHFSKFDDGVTDRFKTVSDIQDNIVEVKLSRYRFGIWDDNEMVGGISIEGCNDDSAEIGFWVGAEHVGKGYASKALNLLIGFGYGQLGKSELFANVKRDNDASIAVLERAGFLCDDIGDDDYLMFRRRKL